MTSKKTTKRAHVVLAEPGLHASDGHMRGELEAMACGLHSISADFSVVGWKAPIIPLPSYLNADFVDSNLEEIISALPARIGVRLVEFQVYRKAFTIARRCAKNAVVVGLTASGPFGPALAALSISKLPTSILITRHTGDLTQSRNYAWRYSFKLLAKRGCGFGTYSTAVATRMEKILPNHMALIRHLPEVIAEMPTIKPTRGESLDEVLIVSGLDSMGRRSPIKHLLEIANVPFKKVILHDPSGKFLGCNELERKHSSSVVFERVSTYFTTDFVTFLRKASAVLVAYSPSFINPSSVLRHSLSAGVPAIASRFPDSEFLVKKFGKIGELWNFNDITSLNAAMNRLIKWNNSDFSMLDAASRSLWAWANPTASALAHLDFALYTSHFTKR